MKDIAVIVPAWNEAQCIEENILELEAFLSRNFSSHEIIISEDGSTDGTDRIVRKLSANNADITHLHSDERLGKGKAVSNAVLSSGSSKIFLMDADFPTSLSSIPKMTRLLEGYDMVLGSRLEGKKAERPLMRTLMSMSYNSLVRLFFRTGIKDHQCGVKAFRSRALKSIMPEMESAGFFWDTELIVRAKRGNLSIMELPIPWQERRHGSSKISVLREVNRMGKSMIKMWYDINFGGKG
jgi:glycosyltransferase involved in cell wall biosynthesis